MAALPSRTEASSFSSTFLPPVPSLTVSRGAVPMPSIWPRASTRHAAPLGCWKRQNLRLDDPAFRTRAKGSMAPPLRGRPAGVGHLGGDGTTGDPRPHAVGPTGEDDRDPGPEDQPGAVRVRQEAELLGQDVPGLQVRGEQDVRVAR